MTPIRSTAWLTVTLACALYACGDDDGAKNTDAGSDGGSHGGHDAGGNGKDAGGDAAVSGKDASTAQDAAVDAASGDDAGQSGGQTFSITAGNLSFDFTTDSGVKITFEFPASAAGKDITVEAVDPSSIDWANADFKTAFSEAIKLGPDGTTFATPVKITPSNGSLFAFNFADESGVPEPLDLAGDGQSLLLTHFSTLAILPPTALCDSVGGWSDTPNGQGCTGATNVYRYFTAKCYKFCYTVQAGCCVDPSVTSNPEDGCEIGAPSLSLSYQRSGTNGGQYPYCADGLPTATDVTGSLVAGGGDQTITVTGTNFDPNGSVYINLDVMVPTTWVSSTSATATVPGSALLAAGTLTGIGFINPKWNAAGACNAQNLGNCDFQNKTTPALSEPIAAPAGPTCLSGGSAASSVTGSGTCADPYVIDMRTQQIDAVVSHSLGQGSGADESVPGSAACGISTTARDIAYRLLVPAGADFDVSVDAASGADPVVFTHEDNACAGPINACGNDGATSACEVASAVRTAGDFYGNNPGVTISEVTSSSTALTVRFALRGAVQPPSLVSVTPSPVTNQSGTIMTATFNNYTELNATGTITKSSVLQEYVTCVPASSNTCTFTLPNSLSAGVHDIQFSFATLAGSPVTASTQFTVN